MAKTVLITGAAKRLGRSLALFLAKENYNIVITYNKSKFDAEDLKKEIELLGRKCGIYQIDFNVLSNVQVLLDKIFQDFPDISVLINNASIFEENRFAEIELESLSQNFNVHCFAPLLLSQSFAQKVTKGKIINITDIRVKTETLRFFPYLLSKKSLANLTKMLAEELKPNIEVNEIRPGILLENKTYDPQEDLANKYTERQDINSFHKAIKMLLDKEYYGEVVEL